MTTTQIHTTCLAALLLTVGCDSGSGDDDSSGETMGATSSASTTSDPSGGSSADESSGPESTSGQTSGFDDAGSAGSSGGTDTFASTSSGSTGFGTTGGGVLDCQALASEIPVARELTVNAAFGGALPDLDFGSDVLVVDFGDAASQSCLGVGAPACAPDDELVPWSMFELQLAPAAQDLGNYAIGPSELIAGQVVETASQEPSCNSVITREEFFAAFTIYGVSTSLDGEELTGLDAYFCDYDGEVWRLEINICG